MDEMKKETAVKVNGSQAVFEYVYINFFLTSFNPNRDTIFTLVLLEEKTGRTEEEIGRYALATSGFVSKFKENHTKVFRDKAKLGDYFQLDFEVLIDSTRFGLEKFSR